MNQGDEKKPYIETYRQEAEEHLSAVEEAVLDIEENPDDSESLNRLFRAFHTIKGSGAMFGFDEIAGFTHHVETVLDHVRDGSLGVTKSFIDLILAARDQIKAMLDTQDDGEPVDIERSAQIIAGLNALKSNMIEDPELLLNQKNKSEAYKQESTYRIRFRPDLNIFKTGTDPGFLLAELRELGECSVVLHKQGIPGLDELDPEQCYMHWNVVLTTSKDIQTIQDVFIFVEDTSLLKIEMIDDPEDMSDGTRHRRIGEILVERGDLSCEALKQALKSQKRVGEILVEREAVDMDVIESALSEQKHVRTLSKKRREIVSASTVRIPADRLDHLINLVGELVITQARLSQVAQEADHIELANPVEEIERLTAELRDCALTMRMTPIGTTFGKFRRLVRDLSDDLKKEIILTARGGDTELDKTVIERLDDPLVHLIRNCVDHGIESPEERRKHGKPIQGTIELTAAHKGAHVIITIEDDGRGLNPEIINVRALEQGLISKDAGLSEKDIFSLIFQPGFSTAKEVTQLSGRGVGLDVVKRQIESLGGTIQISSHPGKGTSFTLWLPLTLAIIDGFLVQAGISRFVLPLAMVQECIELPKICQTPEQARNMIHLRSQVIPYIRLREIFDLSGSQENNTLVEQMVIVQADDLQAGIVVDDIIGNHQTVIKPLNKAYRGPEGISAATIMGDGSVALILDVPGLIRLAALDEAMMIQQIH